MTTRQARRLFLRYRATGDPEALGRVFDLTASRLLLLALHLVRDGQQAEDLVQTTFLHAIRGAKTYDPGRPLMPWLVGILSHRAKNLQRSQSLRRDRTGQGDPLPEDTEDRRPGPAHMAQNNETMQHVAEALEEVPGPYRQVLVLHLVHGLRPAQIAHALERSPETVRTQLHRGREMLRKALPKGLAVPLVLTTTVLTHTGLAAARAQVLAAARAAMPASAAASTVVVASTLGKSTWMGVAGIALALVAGLLWLTGFDPEPAQVAVDGSRATSGTDGRRAETLEPGTDPSSIREEIRPGEDVALATLTVTVIDEFHRPLPNATAWRWREGDPELQSKTTDDKGRVRFASEEHGGALIATAQGRQPRAQELTSLAGLHEIQLPPTRRVQGRVVVDGKTPPEPLWLRIGHKPKREPLGFLPATLREEVLGKSQDYTYVWTRTDGAFEVGGLTDDWSGNIMLPSYLWLCDADPNGVPYLHWLSEPATGVELRTMEIPSVRGRIVWADTGRPVGKADLSAHVHFVDGESTPLMVAVVDPRGGFRFGVSPGSDARQREWTKAEHRCGMAKITLWISHREASQVKLTFDPNELERPGDVGTIRLQRAAYLWCRVVDKDGDAIPDALLKGTAISRPTDADGRTKVFVADTRRRKFLAGARGHIFGEVEAIDGSGTAQHPLLLKLQPGNFLAIQLPATPGFFRISVTGPSPLCTGLANRHNLSFCWRLGATVCSSVRYVGRNKEQVAIHYDSRRLPAGEREILLPSLVANQPIEIKLMDRLKQEAASARLEGLSPGETKRVSLHPEKPLITITGRTVDALGRPLPNVRVSVSSHPEPKRLVAYAENKGDGRFCIPDVVATGARLRLVAEHRGYVKSIVDNVPVVPQRPDSEPLLIRLAAGRDVKVEFVDPDGTRVPAQSCFVEDVDDPRRGGRLEPGSFLFKDLPIQIVTFRTEIAGHEYRLRHDTRNENASFVVPTMGRCTVESTAALRAEGETLRVRIRTVPSGDLAAATWLRGKVTRLMLLLPGRYNVEVGTGSGNSFRAVTEAKPVTVKARQTTHCRF